MAITDTLIANCVDLIFQVNGSTIPRQHGYALYGAISHQIQALHGDTDIGIFPIRGATSGDGKLLLDERSSLRLRVPAAKLPMLLPLAGKRLNLGEHLLRIGVPRVAALDPAPVLASPLVLIKLAEPGEKKPGEFVKPGEFLAAAKRKLEEMEIRGEAGLQLIQSGGRAGQAKRRVLEIKGQTHVGYAMVVQGLTAEESVRLQERGLGGRRLMGCGLFLPCEMGRDAR